MEFEREQTMHTCECEILLKKLSQHAIECVTAKILVHTYKLQSVFDNKNIKYIINNILEKNNQ